MRYQDALRNWYFDGGDPNGMVYDPAHLVQHASAVILAKEIGELLERFYSGHQWFIEVDEHGGIVKLWAGSCSGEWGFIIKMADIQDERGALRRAIIRAGGEILERFNQPIGRYDRDAWLAAPRYATGELKPNITDRPKHVRRRERDETIDRLIRQGAIQLEHVDQGNTRHLLMRDARDIAPTEQEIIEASTYRQRAAADGG